MLTDDVNHPLAGPLGRSEKGIEVTAPGDLGTVLELARDTVVVRLLGADADDVIAEVVARIETLEDPPELEVITGSWDLPGAHLLDLVAVMDRLRSPGGCPWDAEQTHESLVEYLVEEAYETVEAIETGDDAALREELGDVLLQVAFHARIAEERDDPWSIDDVADGITAKLVRRHPHVFSDHVVRDADEVEANWRRLKAEEKGRESVTDGIPLALPALVLAGQAAAPLGRGRGRGARPAGALRRPDRGRRGRRRLRRAPPCDRREGLRRRRRPRAGAPRGRTPAPRRGPRGRGPPDVAGPCRGRQGLASARD